jgi:prepilin-type N-terminal cleavage/methylation domain-containing protein
MPVSVLRRIVDSARGEDGFTLMELLVVMVASVVVLGALFTILDVTLRQTSRTFSMVDASQESRIGLEKLENELHSACVGSDQSPIQTGSSATSLVFISQYGSTASNANAASLTPVQHTITLSGSALTDTTTAASNANAPWTFGGASSTQTILSNVTTAMSGSTALPVFQYFAYAEPYSAPNVPYRDAAGNTYEMLMDGITAVPGTSTVPAAAPLPVPLSSTDATNAAEVLINVRVKPSGGTDVNNSAKDSASWASVSDQVVLRLTPPDNHAGSGADFSPCL